MKMFKVAQGVVKRAFCTAASLALLLLPAEAQASVKIDLTVSTNRFAVNRTITWNLGTSGMRGWIDFGWPETPDQGGITDFAPYQILVTTVGTNTPAYGILTTNDVILGASTGAGDVPLFTRDARQSLGWALGDAEASTGVLKLKRWRAGVTNDVSITLPVMGAYSDTAPYNCAKTALVMTNAAKALAQRINTYGWTVDGPGSINALALLSTGITNYLPMIQTFARQLAPTNMNAEASGGIGGWSFYEGIFLAEYYMLTGDAQVLHGLNEYVLYGARHMSMYGSGMSGVPPPEGWEKGSFHGSCPWYGPINNCTLVVQLTIALGKKAGITDVEMAPAIARASNFYSYFVDRGCIPYGEHAPYCGEQSIDGRTYWNHRSNGKDGLAAILFNVIGDRPVQAQYYSRMALSEYNGEWNGHTGQGFSYLWTELGANVGGTNAAKAYQQKMRWDRDMKRRLDGSFVYEGGEQMGAGYNVTDYWDKPQAEGGPQVYYDNATAYYLIHAAIPLQKLYITGKNPNPTNQLSAAAVSNALWSAQYPETCGGYTTNQLLSHLAEFDPIVRMNAATELSLRSGVSDLVPQLIAFAINPTNANLRSAACYTLGVLHSTNAVPTLVARLSDTDYWVRYRAAEALGPWNAQWQGSGMPVDATVAYLTSMMATYITNATPTYPLTYGSPTPGFNWDDPMQQANGMLGVTIFNPGNLGTYTINTPKNLLWPAVKAGMKHPSGDWVGNSMDDFMSTLLTLEDVKELAVELFQMAELPPPLCAMYNESGPRTGKRVLSKYQITEGIDICMNYTAFWGWGPAAGYDLLWPYLENARQKLPNLIDQKLAWSYTINPVGGENYGSYMRAIANIDAATNAPALIYGRPYAAPQILVTPVNTAKAITLVGTSCRTGLVTYAISTQPAHGTLSGTAPNLTYTPSAGYQGMDSFTFTATDYVTASTPGTVHVLVGTAGIGVLGQYYDNVDFTTLKATVTNPVINFVWGSLPPTNTMASTTYSVRWTGQVLAPESGLYRFSTRTSDGVRLWVNGKLVIDDWNDQPTNLWNDTEGITLTAGSKYNLKMEYYRNTTPAKARLSWYMPSRPECTIIPQELLFPETGVSLTSPTNGAGYASASSVTLTADVADMAGTVTNVAFYSGAVLLGNDTTAPYSLLWTNLPAGAYSLTARAAANNGTISTSAVSVITVDGRTVPVSSGLVCWYDASYGVTVDRKQSVRAWEDRSGNGHNAVLHFNDGNPELMRNQLFTRPALRFNNYMTRCWLDVSRPMFVKEQYVIVRNYTINPWNLGAFLGRRNGEASSYLLSGTGFAWLPAGVSKNGTVLSSPFDLAPTTDWMVLKITVNDWDTSEGSYLIGGSGNYYAAKFDVAEIIGYSRTLTAQEEAAVGGYIESKYGVTTAYPGTGSLANQSASGLTESAATLNGTLLCNGTNYGVTAYWGTTDGGLTENWDHTATVGSWNNVASTNFSLPVSGLLPATTYTFTFRGTNSVSTGTIWAAPSQSFTTLSTNKVMLTFGDNVARSSAVIDTGARTVAWTVPFSSDVTTLSPTYAVSPYATGNPVSGTSRNFTTPQTYSVIAQNLSSNSYTVTVTVEPPSSAKTLLTFGQGTLTNVVFNGTNILWTVLHSTSLTNLAPVYTISPYATGTPASGTVQDFTTPKVYTVTAEDGTSQNYVVSVTNAPPSPACDFLTFGPGATIIGSRIDWPVPYGSSLTALAPTFTVSPFASGSPASGTTRDFTTSQTYTVTAEDGTTNAYLVTAIPNEGSEANWTFSDGTGTDSTGNGHTLLSNYGAGGIVVDSPAGWGPSTSCILNTNGNYFAGAYPIPGPPLLTNNFVLGMYVCGYDPPYNWNQGANPNCATFLDTDANYPASSLLIRAVSNAVNYWEVRLANVTLATFPITTAAAQHIEVRREGGISSVWLNGVATGTNSTLPFRWGQSHLCVTSGGATTYRGLFGDITVTRLPQADIRAFGPGATITGTNIAWTVPTGTDASSLSPTYTLSTGATCDKASGATNNFTSPVTYTVISLDNAVTNVYTVAVHCAQTITFAPLAAKTYGDAPFSLTATSSSGLTVSYTSSDTNVATVAGSTVTILKAGTTTITATQAGNAIYSAATPLPQTLPVNQATQTITFGALAAMTYGDAPFELGATASSGLTVSYESSDTNVATVVSNLVTILKAGSTTLTASQAGTPNYTAATSVPQALTVNQRPVLLSGTRLYDATTTAAAADLTITNKIFGDDLTLSGSGTLASRNVGAQALISSATLALGGTASTNYTLTGMSAVMTITPKPLTLSGTTVTNKIYDATVVAMLTNGALLAAEVPGTGTTADNKPYTGDTVGVTLSGTFDTKDAGVSKAVTSTSSLTGAQAGNYSLTQPAGLMANVTPKALAVTGAAIASKPYDGATNATFSAGALLAEEAPGTGSTADNRPYTGDVVTLNLSGLFASKNVAAGIAVTSTSSLTGAQADNYALTQPAGLTGEITARTLTITASDQSKTFGDTLAFGSGSTLFFSSVLQAGETIGSVTLVCTGGGAGASVGTYPITPSAATGGTFTPANYAITYNDGTLTVNRSPQTITFGTLTVKTYGDVPFGLTATASSGLTVSYASSDTNVATVAGSTVSILKAGSTVITATQAGDASYAEATPVPQTLTVNQATQTITFVALADKTYGDAPFSLTATASSGLTVSYTSSDTNVAIVVSNLVTILQRGSTTLTATQAGDASYAEATPVPQTLTVNQATQTITFVALADKTYGDSPFELTATASSGLAVSYESSDTNVATVAGSTVTILNAGATTLTASQAGNTNFAAAAAVPQTLTVNKATPVLTWNAPATITVGTALSSNQLNATSGGVAGTFTYTPPAGTVLPAGGGQTLSVHFTPTDTATYNTPADKQVAITVTAVIMAEDFEHEWADNALARTTNGWTSSGLEDLSSITNPAVAYGPLPYGRTYPLVYNHTASRRLLKLDTQGDVLSTPTLNAGFERMPMYADMMVRLDVTYSVPSDYAGLKAAVFFKADGTSTNLYVYHGQKTADGFGVPLFTPVTNGIAPDAWHRLTVMFDATTNTIGAEAFRVLIDGQALVSTNAYSDAWATRIAGNPYTPDSGTWFLSAARREGTAGTNLTSLAYMAFKGTGLIDDLVVTADKPTFSLGTVLLLAYGTTGDSETAPWL